MSLAQAIDKWIKREEKRLTQSAGDASLAEDVVGASGHRDIFDRAATDGLTTMMASIKQDVAEGMRQSQGMGALYANADIQTRQLQGAQKDIREMGDLVDAITDTINQAPQPSGDKSGARSALESVQTRMQKAMDQSGLEKAISEVARNYEISDADIESLKQTAATPSPSTGRGQSVREIRDRFYEVSTTQADPDETGWSLVQPDFEQVASLSGITLKPTDTGAVIEPDFVDHALAQDLNQTAELVPNKPRKGASDTSAPFDDVQEQKDTIQEEFAYPVYACLLLQLAQQAQSLYDDLEQKVREIIDAHNILDDIRQNRPVDRLLDKWQSDLMNSARDTLNQSLNWSKLTQGIEVNSTTNEITLGLRAHLSAQSIPTPSQASCQQQKQSACQSRARVKKLIRQIDRASFSLVKTPQVSQQVNLDQHIQEATQKYEDMLAQLGKIERAVDDLKRSLCAWIQQNRAGKPEAASNIQTLAAGMAGMLAGALATMQGWKGGLAESSRITQAVERLKKFGLDDAAQSLQKGDTASLFQMDDPSDGTTAGQASQELAQKANEAQTRNADIKYQQMANAAEARSEQVSIEMRLRDSMGTRLQQNDNVQTAKTIKTEATMLEDNETSKEPPDPPKRPQSVPGAQRSSSPDAQSRPPIKMPDAAPAAILQTLPAGAKDGKITSRTLPYKSDQSGLFKVTLTYKSGGQSQEVVRWVAVARYTDQFSVKKPQNVNFGPYQ